MKKYLRILFLIMLLVSACSRQPEPTPGPVEDVPSPAITEPTRLSSPTATPAPSATITLAPDPTSTPTPTPAVPPDPFWGIHVHKLSDVQRLDIALEAGSAWARFDRFHWTLIEPENLPDDALVWDSVDEVGLINAAERDVQVVALVQLTPPWAQLYDGVSCGPIRPEALDDFADFMHALVSRYSQPPYNVKVWELINEPDIDPALVAPDSEFGCWGREGDPYYGGGDYAQMLERVYPRIKQADPEAIVLVGGLVLFCDPVNPPETSPGSSETRDCTPSRYLEGILEAGGGEFFDGVSFHAYDYYTGVLGGYENGNWHSSSGLLGPTLVPKARYLRSLLSSYGYNDKGLYNTETAVLCGSSGNEPYCSDDIFNATKAAYTAQANAAALAEGLVANIWYSLPGWRASGLINGQLQPFPAYDAYRFSVQQLQDAVYAGEVQDYEGLLGYKFNRSDKRVMMLWSRDTQPHRVDFDTPPAEVYDVYGEDLSFEDGFEVGPLPVYFEWDE